ncbi:RidA family protein [Aliiglaciecola sp. SL4]|uniref:RidA family protein n=1 Tax=Aliiglaciecola sp. SL4 TaxID=3239806 RepID=UPI00355C9D49
MALEKKTFRSGPFADFIAQGVQVGNILYMSGQIGMDEEGNVADGVLAQVELAYENLKLVLAEFGATIENVVDETYFVTDVEELMINAEVVYTAREKAYGGTPEVSQTVIQVAALVDPRLKLEIKCSAHLN